MRTVSGSHAGRTGGRTLARLALAIAIASNPTAQADEVDADTSGPRDPGAALEASYTTAGGGVAPNSRYFRDTGEADASGRRPELIGLVVNGRDTREAATYLRPTDDLPAEVALDAVLVGAGLDWAMDGDGWRITTPIGDARLGADQVRVLQGVPFVAVPDLAHALAARAEFDPAELALRLDLPFDPVRDRTPPSPAKVVSPDIQAPVANLSLLRGQLISTHYETGWTSTLDSQLGGLLANGHWNLETRSVSASGTSYSELNSGWWLREADRARYLLGIERLTLHPLLNSLELAGAQGSYTNAPEQVYTGSYLQRGTFGTSGQLVPYAASPTSVIRGHGPPGGTAVLRIGGRAVARRLILLDGTYEFRDVPAAPGDTLQVEVALYEFGSPGAPVAIDQYYSQAGNLQLPRGTVVHYGGVGEIGNRLRHVSTASDELGAFYQVRYGLSQRITVESALQTAGERRQGVVGSAVNLGRAGVWAGYVARNDDGDGAWQLLGDGRWSDWFWLVDARQRDAGYSSATSSEEERRRAEVGRTWGSVLRASLIHGYDRRSGDDEISYVKPAFDWRPNRRIMLSARPSYDGEYSYHAQWSATDSTRLSATRYSGLTQLELEQRLGSRLRGRLSAWDSEDGRRYGAQLSGYTGGPRRVSWLAGLLEADGELGYQGNASLEIVPGLLGRIEVYKDPLNAASDTPVVQLSLVADFAVTPSGLARGAGYGGRAQRDGGISGSITTEWRPPEDDGRLAGIAVLIDGRVRGRTDLGGRYLVDRLEPGIYRVELDTDKLPIELSVREKARWAEVKIGGVTRVDFTAELVLGLAGRVEVRDAASALPEGLAVIAVAQDGDEANRATPNKGGYFRIDGLPPGRYRLEVRDPNGEILATRGVELVHEFLFRQDLVIDAVIAPEGEGETGEAPAGDEEMHPSAGEEASDGPAAGEAAGGSVDEDAEGEGGEGAPGEAVEEDSVGETSRPGEVGTGGGSDDPGNGEAGLADAA